MRHSSFAPVCSYSKYTALYHIKYAFTGLELICFSKAAFLGTIFLVSREIDLLLA